MLNVNDKTGRVDVYVIADANWEAMYPVDVQELIKLGHGSTAGPIVSLTKGQETKKFCPEQVGDLLKSGWDYTTQEDQKTSDDLQSPPDRQTLIDAKEKELLKHNLQELRVMGKERGIIESHQLAKRELVGALAKMMA